MSDSVLYVAVDIGCIECGESSKVLGVFTDANDAEQAVRDGEALGWRGGQHHYGVFVVELNERYPFDDRAANHR